MNIDFIKWMCEKAEGFEIDYHKEWCSVAIDDVTVVFDVYSPMPSNKCVYSLLLQRAIESVNKEGSKYFIEQLHNQIMVGFFEEYVFEPDNGISDNAKESALLYIYNQEKNH